MKATGWTSTQWSPGARSSSRSPRSASRPTSTQAASWSQAPVGSIAAGVGPDAQLVQVAMPGQRRADVQVADVGTGAQLVQVAVVGGSLPGVLRRRSGASPPLRVGSKDAEGGGTVRAGGLEA